MQETGNHRKMVGILGGMGPEATVSLFNRIVEKTPALRDQDHIKIIIYNNPTIPDRTQSILHDGKSPLPMLKQGARFLERSGADFIAIPCNSAHYYLDKIRGSVNIPVMDMINETALIIRENKVGLLATDGTVQIGLYHKACINRGIEIITPSMDEQKRVMQVIYDVKAGKDKLPLKREIAELLGNLQKRGAEALVLGCTELSLVLTQSEDGLPVYDALDILAQTIVKEALSERNI